MWCPLSSATASPTRIPVTARSPNRVENVRPRSPLADGSEAAVDTMLWTSAVL